MLLDRSNWPKHRPWFWIFVVGTLAAVGWYAFEAWHAPRWPGGSSLSGLVFGFVGGLLCLFEFTLWLRKQVRYWPLGRAQAWLRAHIWLGLLTVPVLVLHSGFRFGGTLSTLLSMLLIVVVLSGIWGLAMQHLLPKKLLDEVPDETVAYQIERLSVDMEEEARQLVEKICGVTSPPSTPAVGHAPKKSLGKAIPGAEPIAVFFMSVGSPYLLRGARGQPVLAQPVQAKAVFDNLRGQVPPEAQEVVNMLEGYCRQRRQWELQARVQFWLHNWLWVHFPLSVSLIVLMFVHAWVALRYY